MLATVIFEEEDEDKIDPEILEAIEWFWAEEYKKDYLKKQN